MFCVDVIGMKVIVQYFVIHTHKVRTLLILVVLAWLVWNLRNGYH